MSKHNPCRFGKGWAGDANLHLVRAKVMGVGVVRRENSEKRTLENINAWGFSGGKWVKKGS